MRFLNRLLVLGSGLLLIAPLTFSLGQPTAAAAANQDYANELFPTVSVDDGDDQPQSADGGLLFRSAATVELNESIAADLVVAAETVMVNEQIAGDLFAAANSVVINDGVSGSLRIAANEVVINGSVGRNALIFANRIVLGPNGMVAGDASFFGSEIVQQGEIKRSAAFYGEEIIIDGVIGGTLTAEGGQVTLDNSAVLKSPSQVFSGQEVQVHADAKGEEQLTYTKADRESFDDRQRDGEFTVDAPDWVGGFVAWLFLYVAVGLVGVLIVTIWPGWFKRSADTMVKEAGMSWLLGILFVFATPMVAILLTFTLIGIPLAMALWFVYGVGHLLGALVAGIMIGLHAFPAEKFPNEKQRVILSFLVGYLLISVIWFIPFLGWLLGCALAVWGAGALLVLIMTNRAKPTATSGGTAQPTTARTVAARPSAAAARKRVAAKPRAKKPAPKPIKK